MNTTYENLQSEIKKALNQDFKNKKIEFIDLMAILWILSQAKDENELNILLEAYRSDYSSLDYLLSNKESKQKEEFTQNIQTMLASYLKENPDEAKKVLAYMKKNKKADATEIFSKFPDFKNISQ